MFVKSQVKVVLGICWVIAAAVPVCGEPFTINDAINMAVQTNPSVGESSANKRATEAELHQSKGTLLPQVRLETSAGPLRTNQRDVTPPPLGNDTWLPATKGSIVVRQLLFDGFASTHEIWRQAARVDAAAARVHERGELTALDAAEAYIDIVRFTRLVALAGENARVHRRMLSNVQSRFSGGRAGEGDLAQTKERVAAAEAAEFEFRRSLEDARAKFRKVIGVEPFNLRGPGRLVGLPVSKDQVLAVTLTDNPTIKAAQSDVDAARSAFHATSGAFMPNVSLEGRATEGKNADNFFGHYSQDSVQVVASWEVFRGGQDSWKRAATAERYTQATMTQARFQRDAYESVDKAWSARTITAQRIVKLQSQIAADRKVIGAYSKEFDLGQRSLIDLLNAENQLFNAQVSLESAKGVAIFADYQLLATMGKLLDYLNAPHPVDAEPLVPASFGLLGLFPNKLPPLLITLPHPGSEPLNVAAPLRPVNNNLSSPPLTFSERWGDLSTERSTPPALPPLLITLPHPDSEPLNVAAPLPPVNNNLPSPPLTFFERWGGLSIGRSTPPAMGFTSEDLFSQKSMTTNMPNKLPPLLITLPHPDSEPLNVAAPLPPVNNNLPFPSSTLFERWGGLSTGRSTPPAMGFTSEDLFSQKSMTTNVPHWPLKTAKAN